ncbi:MAG TPA: DUF5947 family protein [Rhizomicrobium sp.]|jgi:hypothetical protein
MPGLAREPAKSAKAVFALRRFVYPPKERCEFCRAGLPGEHAHLLEPAARKIRCACVSCVALCGPDCLPIIRRKEKLGIFAFSDAQWDALQIPVDLAFLVRHADGRSTAHYPGPAGVVDSAFGSEVWSEIAETNPFLADMTAEVEALLLDRAGGGNEAYRLSIDHCYALAGLIRKRWRGLSGGEEVRREIRAYLGATDGAGHA